MTVQLDEPAKGRPARLVLHQRLRELAHELDSQEPRVREGAVGGVHRTRQACRRLRALLATYRPLLDRTVSDPVRDELGWLARSLGEARDHEVALARIESLVDAEPDELVVGPVRSRLSATRAGRLATDERQVREVLDSERYRSLRADLDRLVADPPWTALAERPARAVLPRRVARDWDRMWDRHLQDGDPHEARRAAKRLRYACETLEPVWGKDARRLRRAAQRVTVVLGDRQDTVVSRELLWKLGEQATRAGESAFTWGRLHAEEQAHADDLDRRAEIAWHTVAQPKRLRWTR